MIFAGDHCSYTTAREAVAVANQESLDRQRVRDDMLENGVGFQVRLNEKSS